MGSRRIAKLNFELGMDPSPYIIYINMYVCMYVSLMSQTDYTETSKGMMQDMLHYKSARQKLSELSTISALFA